MRGLTKKFAKLFIVVFSFLIIVLAHGTAKAGSEGTYNSVTGEFSFSISIRFLASHAFIDSVRDRFEEASELLHQITNSRQRFGTITIYNNQANGDKADFWILPVKCGQSLATPGNFGLSAGGSSDDEDFAVRLYRDRIWDEERGCFTIVHEFGHHAFGLFDEYAGPFNQKKPKCKIGSPRQVCIMDDYYRRGDPSTTKVLVDGCDEDDFPKVLPEPVIDRFCTEANHNDSTTDDLLTHQQNELLMSCQAHINSQINRIFPIPPNETRFERPNFPDLVELDRRIILIIDRSASMRTDDRIGIAKNGAIIYIDKVSTGINLGIISFDTDIKIDFPLKKIQNQTDKKVAANAIRSLPDAGGSTQMADALREALDQLPASLGTADIFILLSDGFSNNDDETKAVIPALQDRNIVVHTIGIGGTVNEDLMEEIASQTGGNFFNSVDPVIDETLPSIQRRMLSNPIAAANERKKQLILNIENIFTLLLAVTQDGGIFLDEARTITPGKTDTIPALVDIPTNQAIFALNWAGSKFGLNLTLLSPDTTIIDSLSTIENPDITFISDSTAQSYIVDDPADGDWHLVINARSVEGSTDYRVFGLSDAKNTGLFVNTDKSTYIAPEPILIRAQPFNLDVPIAGAEVIVTVSRPNAPDTTITLFDNGDINNSDNRKDDGVYSNLFRVPVNNNSGLYKFKITATNKDGFVAVGEAIDGSPDSRTPDAFTRINTLSRLVMEGTKENFVFGIDNIDGTFIKVEMSDKEPEVIKLGHIVEEDCGKIKKIRAMAWDPFRNTIFVASIKPKPQLFKIDPINIPDDFGKACIEADLIGKTKFASPRIEGLAVHPITGELFGVDDNNDWLLKIDKNSGATKRIGKLNFKQIEAIAFTLEPEPILYGADTKTRQLIIINPATGKGTLVHPTNKIGFRDIEALAVDLAGNLIGYTSRKPLGFVKIDRNTGIGERFNVDGASKYDIEGMAFLVPQRQTRSSPLVALATGTRIFSQKVLEFSLSQNTIQFELPEADTVSFQILDSYERPVCKLVEGFYAPGTHSIGWDGKDDNGNILPEGVYFCQMKVGTHSKVKKIRIKR